MSKISNKKDDNLGHVWKMCGDVARCINCKKYLGLWDGTTPCNALKVERPNQQKAS